MIKNKLYIYSIPNSIPKFFKIKGREHLVFHCVGLSKNKMFLCFETHLKGKTSIVVVGEGDFLISIEPKTVRTAPENMFLHVKSGKFIAVHKNYI